ncbi:MAG: DUF2752 domain-containing protein [Muribaculaceae bacterium]|nr:DUF2752 domain-containing protein [Muribaculaceae bacterium]
MKLSSGKPLLKFLMATVIAVAIVIIYYLTDPAVTVWMPKCPVKMISGYDCPGCGSQRMIHALLHLDFPAAWDANPFLILSIPYILLLAFISLAPRSCTQRYPRLTHSVQSPTAVFLFLAAACIWTIIRNLP